jgi:hypothetical protein
LRPFAHSAFNGQDKLIADFMRFSMNSLSGIGIENDLNHSFTIAQIDKNNAPVISAAVRPAHQNYFFIGMGNVQVTAIMSSLIRG